MVVVDRPAGGVATGDTVLRPRIGFALGKISTRRDWNITNITIILDLYITKISTSMVFLQLSGFGGQAASTRRSTIDARDSAMMRALDTDGIELTLFRQG